MIHNETYAHMNAHNIMHTHRYDVHVPRHAVYPQHDAVHTHSAQTIGTYIYPARMRKG